MRLLAKGTRVRLENPYGVQYGTLRQDVFEGVYTLIDFVTFDGDRLRTEARAYPEEGTA